MLSKLIFLFIAVPMIEISLLIKLGESIGFWPTLLLQIGTGVLGASLAKLQGLLIWQRIMAEFQMGRVPTGEMLDGVLVLAAGIVLMTPGLLTDLLGFALLIPLTRNQFKTWLSRQFEMRSRPNERVIGPF